MSYLNATRRKSFSLLNKIAYLGAWDNLLGVKVVLLCDSQKTKALQW
ncbi:hypothetical protein [Ruegeria sp.]